MKIRALKEGMTGEDVLVWKTFLREKTAYYRGELNSVFDSETRQATLDFQRFHELPGSGELTGRTLAMALLMGLDIVG